MSNISVTFTVKAKKGAVQKGCDLAILGSCKQLGCWDETQSVLLSPKKVDSIKDSSSSMTYYTLTISLPLGQMITYKYIIRYQKTIVAWERIIKNRVVVPGMHNLTQQSDHLCTRQSSTYVGKREPFGGERSSAIAINGNISGHHEYLCQHTELDYQAWWDIDLNRCYDVRKIIIYNREGSCSARILPFWVLLSDTSFPPWRVNTLDECRLISKWEIRITNLQDIYELNVSNDSVSSRYCRVILENENFLHMAEVQIWCRNNEEESSNNNKKSNNMETKHHKIDEESRTCIDYYTVRHTMNDGELAELDTTWLGSSCSIDGNSSSSDADSSNSINSSQGDRDDTNLITLAFNTCVNQKKEQVPSINYCQEKKIKNHHLYLRPTLTMNNEEPKVLSSTSTDIVDWNTDIIRFQFYCTDQMLTSTTNSICLEVFMIHHEKNEKKDEKVGFTYITLNQIDKSLGKLILPLLSSNSIICGSIALTYSIAKPCRTANNTLEHVYRTHWSKRKVPLDVGHRGLGKSEHKSKPEYRLSAIKENSLMSFIVAGRLGADFIEFDVGKCFAAIIL
jgi:hypothetical protein